MAKIGQKPTAPQKGDKTSGRTMGRMLTGVKNKASESRPLRVKNQLQPLGKNRFPEGKYTQSDPTGTKTWEDLDREWEEAHKKK